MYLLSFGFLTEHQATPVKAGKEREGTAMKCPLGTSQRVMHFILTEIFRGELWLALLHGRGNWNEESVGNLFKITPQVNGRDPLLSPTPDYQTIGRNMSLQESFGMGDFMIFPRKLS